MQVTEAARIVNQHFPATLATRARMLAAANLIHGNPVECRRAIYADLLRKPEPAGASPTPLTVEEAADLINREFEELPAPVRVRMLRAFNICRPSFDLDYTRLIVESEFRQLRRHTTRQDILK